MECCVGAYSGPRQESCVQWQRWLACFRVSPLSDGSLLFEVNGDVLRKRLTEDAFHLINAPTVHFSSPLLLQSTHHAPNLHPRVFGILRSSFWILDTDSLRSKRRIHDSGDDRNLKRLLLNYRSLPSSERSLDAIPTRMGENASPCTPLNPLAMGVTTPVFKSTRPTSFTTFAAV
jgi:hypothetical protein